MYRQRTMPPHPHCPLWYPIVIKALPKLFLPFFLLSFVAMAVYLPNMGGRGLQLPLNLFAWVLGCLLILWGGVYVQRRQSLNVSSPMLFLPLSALLLTLPWFWSPLPEWQHAALGRVVGIWAAMLVFFAMLQFPLTTRGREKLLWCLLGLAVVQALIACVQLFNPGLALRWMEFVPEKTGFRPYGIFQQINVLGSFLATSVGIAGLLLVNDTGAQQRRILLASALVLQWAVIIWVQSRTGVLGAITVTFAAIFWSYRSGNRKAVLWLFVSTLLGVALAIGLVNSPWSPFPAGLDLEHEASSHSRLNMLIGTLKIIQQHPIMGIGLGGFEMTLPHFAPRLEAYQHPHNELLYAWCEGGLSGLLGMLALAGVWLWTSRWFSSAPAGTPELELPGRLFCLTLPIVMHMMLEYPLYQSVPHLLVLLGLIRLAWPEASLRELKWHKGLLPGCSLMMCASLAAALLLMQGLVAQDKVTAFERSGLQDDALASELAALPTWKTVTQAQRLDYDFHTYQLLTYNRHPQPETLTAYSAWANGYLRAHCDANVFFTLMQIANFSHDTLGLQALRQNARRCFPEDPRFN